MITFLKVITSNLSKVLLFTVFLFPLYSQAIPVFEISSPTNSISLKPGESAPSPIELTVRNNSGIDIPNLTFDANDIPSGLFSASIASGIPNSCIQGSTLGKNARCILPIKVKAGSVFGSTALRPRVCGFSGNFCTRSLIHIDVTNVRTKKGHFVFEDSSNTPINSLNLAPGATDTITVKNTGGEDISGFNLTIGTLLSGTKITSNNCTGSKLPKNGSCSFTYSTAATPAGGVFDIKATGSGADNSNHALKITVASGVILAASSFSSLSKPVMTSCFVYEREIFGCVLHPMSASISHGSLTISPNKLHVYYTTAASSSQPNACNIDIKRGRITNCHSTGPNPMRPLGIAVDSNSNRVYVGDDDSVKACDIQPNGDISSSCYSFSNGYSWLFRITIRGNRIYLSDTYRNRIDKCIIDNKNGHISNCKQQDISALSHQRPMPVAITPDGANAYIATDPSRNIVVCDVDSAGDFNKCREALKIKDSRIIAISISKSGNTLYYGDVTRMGHFHVCTIDSSTKELKNCSAKSPSRAPHPAASLEYVPFI